MVGALRMPSTLVIPSLPGYGFSGKPTEPVWNPVSIAKGGPR